MQIHPRLYAKLNAGIQNRFPVILYYNRPAAEVRQCLTRRYGPIKYELPFIHAMAMELSGETIPDISREPMVQWITDDATVSKVEHRSDSSPTEDRIRTMVRSTPSLLNSTPPLVDSSFDPFRGFYTIGNRRPYPVAVSVIDTGVAPHRDLVSPTNRIRAFYDLVGHRTEPYDDDGHGTHISGILCGLGGPAVSVSNPGQHHLRKTGPALVAVKALDHQGNGNASDILAAMQWTLNNSRYYNIRVVNLSLGVTAEEAYDTDPLVRGVEALTRYGLVVITAAGNSGPKVSTISSPGICRSAVTVGAADGDRVADFSSRGPTPQGLIKPDLVAPGVNILSLDAKTLTGYVSQSGTSMAAPFVSRTSAAICARFPGWSPSEIKRLLLHSAVLLPDEPPTAQGCGILFDL